MKILSISNCPLIESQGSGYVIVNFCRFLCDRGHEVDLFGPESFEPLKFLKGRATSYRQALGMLFFTLRQIAKKKYDVLEFYGAESWLTVSLLSRIPRRNFLLISHSNGLETHFNEALVKYSNNGYIENPFGKWYQFNQSALWQNAFTKVDAIVTVSEKDCNYALKHAYKDELHILAIENSLREDYLGQPVDFQREPIVGYCGSWLPRKGIKVITKDITQLLIKFPKYSFKLIGVGANFRKELYFPLVVCPQIEVIPFVKDKQQLRKIYQSLSILVSPSFYESFGIVVAEAMACGCAVVASKVGFAANLKHREEGFIIEEPVSPLLYEGVKELLLNEPLRIQLAKTGYQRVQNLRWNLAVERLEGAYLKWLKELIKEEV